MERESVEIDWERRVIGGKDKSVIRVRRRNGPEEVYRSIEEAPEDIQRMLGEFAERIKPKGAVQAAAPVIVEPEPKTPVFAYILPTLEIRDDGRTLRITRYWGGCVGGLSALLACVFFAVGLLTILKGPPRTIRPSGMIRWEVLFPIAAVLTYMATAFFLNRTVIRVSPKRLSIEHGPVPFFHRSRKLRGAEVDEVIVRASAYKGRWRYDLYARTTDGRLVPFSLRFRNPGRAAELERLIEARLGIDPGLD